MTQQEQRLEQIKDEQAEIQTYQDSKVEEGYTDSVGGYHEGGVGYSPSGRFCGECCMHTCEGCKYAEG